MTSAMLAIIFLSALLCQFLSMQLFHIQMRTTFSVVSRTDVRTAALSFLRPYGIQQ